MDRQLFIRGQAVLGTIAEQKTLTLLNRFNTPDDFRIIQDRNGFGYAEVGSGRRITREQAEAILNNRPEGGFSSLSQVFVTDIVGRDTWSDIVTSAMQLVQFPATKSIEVSLTIVAALTPPAPPIETLDIIAFALLRGRRSNEWIPLARQESQIINDQHIVKLSHLSDDVDSIAIVAARPNDHKVIFRSGPITLSAYENEDITLATTLFYNQSTITQEDFDMILDDQVGLDLGDDRSITALSSELIDGRLIINGTITAEDAILLFDSDVDFRTEIILGASAQIFEGDYRTAIPRVNSSLTGTERLIGVLPLSTSSEHSSLFLKAVGFFGFTIPGLSGFLVPSGVLAADNAIDNASSNNNLIANEIINTFSSQGTALVLEELNNSSELEKLIILTTAERNLGINVSDSSAFEERVFRIISKTATIETINISPAGIMLDTWIVAPYKIQ